MMLSLSREHHLERFLDSSTLADKGYVGLDLLTLTQREPGAKIPVAAKRLNRQVNQVIASVCS